MFCALLLAGVSLLDFPQIDTPAESDTGGLFFPKAITHLFVGMYIQQVALCALFFLAQDQNGKQSAIAEGALMVVLIVITVGSPFLNRDRSPGTDAPTLCLLVPGRLPIHLDHILQSAQEASSTHARSSVVWHAQGRRP